MENNDSFSEMVGGYHTKAPATDKHHDLHQKSKIEEQDPLSFISISQGHIPDLESTIITNSRHQQKQAFDNNNNNKYHIANPPQHQQFSNYNDRQK